MKISVGMLMTFVAMGTAGCGVRGEGAGQQGYALSAEQRARLEAFRQEERARPGPRNEKDRTLSPYFFVRSDSPGVDRLPLESTRAEVDIAGVIARVRVEQVYRNRGDRVLEAIYVFPASTRAAVHAMRMTIGDRVVRAEIQRRKQARDTYEQARREGRTASLLEQQRPNVFQVNVANIKPGDEIRVELDYTELLVPEDGIYEFAYPTVVGPRYSEKNASEAPDEAWVENPHLHAGEKATFPFSIDVTVRSGIPLDRIACASHLAEPEFRSEHEAGLRVGPDTGAGDRDFVLRYALAGGAIESGLMLYPGKDENFFLLMMEPPERIASDDVVDREYVFILDVSGSMHGYPLETAKKLMGKLLRDLRPGDWFNVLFFSGGNYVLSKHSLPATRANVEHAMREVDRHRGGGGTRLLPAMNRALALERRGASRIVVVITDGYVQVEREAFDVIRNGLGEANLFAFGIGTSVNRYLIEGMARAGMGEPFVVTGPGEAPGEAARFASYVSSPLMRGIEVEFEGFDAYDTEPRALPDLFASRPLVLIGKYRTRSPAAGQPPAAVVVRGRLRQTAMAGRLALDEAVISEENSTLRTLWARKRVERLADLERLAPEDARREEVAELGLRYGLLTDETSFVAVDSEVRADGTRSQTVRQPLPMPRGVSDLAIGGKARAFGALSPGRHGAAPRAKGANSGMLGMLGSQGRAGGIGLGGLSTRGYGGGGVVFRNLGTSGRGHAGTASGHGTLRLHAGKSKSSGVVRLPLRKITVRGAMDRSIIHRIARRHLKQLTYCYKKKLLLDPKLAGKIVLRLVIAPAGHVAKVEVVSDTLGAQTVSVCLLQKIRRWRFPSGPGAVIATLPLVLSPGS